MDWHPAIVHFPIVLLPLSVLLDAAALWRRREGWRDLAYGVLVLGALSALAAVLTGNAAAAAYRMDERVRESIAQHENLATVVLLVSLAAVLGRLPLQLQKRGGRQLKGWIAVAATASVLAWLTGMRGGELVYEERVGLDPPAAHRAQPAPAPYRAE